MAAHKFELREGKNTPGLAGKVWFRCSCGRSGRAKNSEAEARAEWREHVNSAEVKRAFTVVVPSDQAAWFLRQLVGRPGVTVVEVTR